MQVIWCLKFCNMTKSGGQSPHSKFWGTCPPSPVIYAHDEGALTEAWGRLHIVRVWHINEREDMRSG